MIPDVCVYGVCMYMCVKWGMCEKTQWTSDYYSSLFLKRNHGIAQRKKCNKRNKRSKSHSHTVKTIIYDDVMGCVYDVWIAVEVGRVAPVACESMDA